MAPKDYDWKRIAALEARCARQEAALKYIARRMAGDTDQRDAILTALDPTHQSETRPIG